MSEALSLSLAVSPRRRPRNTCDRCTLPLPCPALPCPAPHRTARWRLIATRRSDTVTLHVQVQAFRNVTPCRSASGSGRFEALHRLHIQGQPVRVMCMKIGHALIAFQDTGDIEIRNVGSNQLNYTVSHPGRLEFSAAPL